VREVTLTIGGEERNPTNEVVPSTEFVLLEMSEKR
jgi:hypothetical protein